MSPLACFLLPFVLLGPGFVARSPSASPARDGALPADEVREHRAELATGIDARWIELGKPAGETVLFLHGFTGTSRSFLPTMRALARLRPELRLLALDQRGHGGTSLPSAPGCAAEPEGCFRLQDFAADALALLEHLRVERAHIVGHSLGSAVAQELALLHPERVARTVWIGSSAKFSGNALASAFLVDGLVEGPWKQSLLARGLAFPSDAWAMTPLDLDPGMEQWLAENWVVEPGTDPALLAAIVPETARTPLGTWIGALRALGEHDNRERLADLRAPALVLWPIQDVFFGEEPDQRELRAALERAHARHGTPWAWKRYGRASRPSADAPQTDLGHNLQWAAPEAVARELAAFLDEDGAPTRESLWLEGAEPSLRSAPEGALVLGSLASAAAALDSRADQHGDQEQEESREEARQDDREDRQQAAQIGVDAHGAWTSTAEQHDEQHQPDGGHRVPVDAAQA